MRTTICFFTRRTESGAPVEEAEAFAVGFEGREFVWHPGSMGDQDLDARVPTVTVMTDRADDYRVEMLAMERLLSALSYRYRGEITVLNSAGVDWPEAFDPPVAVAGGPDPSGIWHEAPAALEVLPDEELRLVLGLYREGKSAGSPFYRFLSYWNAIEAAFDNDGPGLDRFIEASPAGRPGWFQRRDRPTDGWPAYFRDSHRTAIGHTVRNRPDQHVRDPDDPDDRWRLGQDARLLEIMLRDRVEARWGDVAVRSVPRQAADA